MSYQPLAPRTATAALDNTGRNTGNYTSAFTSDVINQRTPVFECHHMVVISAPAGASAAIYVGPYLFSFTAPGAGAGAEWDPSQPLLLQTGQDVFFFWTTGTGAAPVVTMWFRYDDAIRANQLAGGARR